MKKLSNNFDKKYITWECTTVCNYSCSYCWESCHDGKYRWPDTAQTNKLIDYIYNFSEDKTVTLDIMGGEPTLWPDLERFCHSIKEFASITFSSNGSRTARWWEKFTAPIESLVFSFHPENASIDHYLEMLSVVHKRYRITVLILYHPDYQKFCTDAYTAFLESKLEINCEMKRIYHDAVKYDKSDQQNLFLQYKNSNIELQSATAIDFYVDDILQDPNLLIKNKTNRFRGWHCNLGENYRYIKANGDIQGAACGIARIVGNVYDKGETIAMNPIQCSRDTCDCKVDMMLNSKYDVRVQ